jgi:hypothetical protein
MKRLFEYEENIDERQRTNRTKSVHRHQPTNNLPAILVHFIRNKKVENTHSSIYRRHLENALAIMIKPLIGTEFITHLSLYTIRNLCCIILLFTDKPYISSQNSHIDSRGAIMDMQAVNLILSALTAGAAASTKDITSQAIKDSYNGLKSLIQHRFANHPKAQAALVDYEDDPDTYEKPLAKALTEAHIDQEQDIMQAARQLMLLIQSQQGSSNTVQNFGSVQGQVVENKGSVNMNFGESSKG